MKPEYGDGEMKYYKFVTRELRDRYTSTIDYSNVGKWIRLPESEIDRDGEVCGRGLHLMKVPKPMYFPYEVAYLAEGKDMLGEDEEKARFRCIRLIRQLRFSEIFHPGADLWMANLEGVDLRGANLQGADLRSTVLTEANLGSAFLTEANLRFANLTKTCLQGADLRGANLKGANIKDAIMRNE